MKSTRHTTPRDLITTAAALIFLLLAFGFAGGCDKADAAAPAQGWGALAVELADQYYGGPPTNCTSLTWTFDATPDQTQGAPGLATLADAPGPCFAAIAPQADLYDLCVVVLHEDGHLHGRGHVSEPGAVMYGEPFSDAAGAPGWDPHVRYCYWFAGV